MASVSDHPDLFPPAGLYLPVEMHALRDADTIVVSVPGSQWQWAVRLADCWAPERHTEEGRRAEAFAHELLTANRAAGKELRLFLPAPTGRQLLKALTFDRLVGWIYLDPLRTLNEALVAAGHATRKKP